MKIPTLERPGSSSRYARFAALALSGVILAGCAGNPPKEQFAVTEAAVHAATVAEATKYAPLEMQAARDKWREAELAMQKENYEEARRLAEKAELDARVAERKARAVKTQKALEKAEEGVQILREESQRRY